MFRLTTCVFDIVRHLQKSAFLQAFLAALYGFVFSSTMVYSIRLDQGCSDSGHLLGLAYATIVLSGAMCSIFLRRSINNIVRPIFSCVSTELRQKAQMADFKLPGWLVVCFVWTFI